MTSHGPHVHDDAAEVHDDQFHADLHPDIPGVQQTAHFHYDIEWECQDTQGHNVNMVDAECQVFCNFTDSDEFEPYGPVRLFPTPSIRIYVTKDGPVQIYQRQRTAGGVWSEPTNPVAAEINLQPPQKPLPPKVYVVAVENDVATIEIDVSSGGYKDRDLQGNAVRPAQIEAIIKHPCGRWETLFAINYPDHAEQVTIPAPEGVSTYQMVIRTSNICNVWSEVSDITVFPVSNQKLRSGGSGSVSKVC